MVQIQINNMMAIIQMLVFSLPCVTCVPIPWNQGTMHVWTSQTEEPVGGSLKLHYNDGSTDTIHFNSTDCTRSQADISGISDKIITSVEVASAKFVLYSKIKCRGKAYEIESSGQRHFNASEIGFQKVRTIEQPGCPSPCPWPSLSVSLLSSQHIATWRILIEKYKYIVCIMYTYINMY